MREQVEDLGAQLHVGLAQPIGRLAQEERRQVGNLFAALAQGRHVNPNHAEAIVEVLAEFALGDTLFEVGVGGREHADIHRLRTVLTDRHDLALLQEPQQFRLHVERQVADFIEEQGAAGGGANQARLVGDGPGEGPTTVTEQLAVGEFAGGRSAVVGQEGRGVPRGPDVNGPRHQFLAGAALTGDQHRQVIALQSLDLINDLVHRGAGAEEAWQQRLEWTLGGRVDRRRRPVADAAQVEALARDRRHHPDPAPQRMSQRVRCRNDDMTQAVWLAADGFNGQAAGRVRCGLDGQFGHGGRRSGIGAGARNHANVTAREFGVDDRDIGRNGLKQRGGQLAGEQVRQYRGIHQSPYQRVVGVGRGAHVLTGARWLVGSHFSLDLLEVSRGAKRAEHLGGVLIVPVGRRSRAGLGGEPRQRHLAHRRLVAFADQLEHARTLRDVVIRLGRPCLASTQVTAQAQELAPRTGSGPRIESRLYLGQPVFRVVHARRGEQRFGRD